MKQVSASINTFGSSYWEIWRNSPGYYNSLGVYSQVIERLGLPVHNESRLNVKRLTDEERRK